jgi:hypothetical protein
MPTNMPSKSGTCILSVPVLVANLIIAGIAGSTVTVGADVYSAPGLSMVILSI